MAVERPTFSETWYRVAELHPRLRTTVQVYRQHFRGQMWHVLQDPTSNQFFRLNDAAYCFVAMLDGRRTVSQVWDVCNDKLGDQAPTQGEAIQLLGQLYTSNLLQGELPPDAAGLLNRFRKRRVREVQGTMMNLMFIHIPLFDPDHILNRWVPVVGKIFTWVGLALWMVLVGAGLSFVISRVGELTDRASQILDPANLPLLYVGIILAKVTHEFGHAFACKRFGRLAGGGEVHVMGIMFLVFTPLPYVDASSAWAFRSKWHRIIVGTAGMIVEIAIASIAAIVWANTSPGTVHSICYNIMFVAGVSTILFNANPLLRYDGYYILSDLVEIPNLAPRSRQYIYYLVKKYVWGVRKPTNPAHTTGEKGWFVFYGIASTLYRIIICVSILLMVANKLFILGAMLACLAFVAWVLTPIGKFIRYLATSGELARVRARAVGSVVVFMAALVVLVGTVKAPDRARVTGIIHVASDKLAVIQVEVDGFLESVLPSGTMVDPDDPQCPPLMTMVNPTLTAELERNLAERRGLVIRQRLALTQEPAIAQSLQADLHALDVNIRRLHDQLALLTRHAPMAGLWVAPKLEQMRGAYLDRTDRNPVGIIIDPDELIIRATVTQTDARLIDEIQHIEGAVSIRLWGRPGDEMTGTVIKIAEAGQRELPSPALGFPAGGRMRTAPDDPGGTKSAEQFFEVIVRPENAADVPLLVGQRVMLRFDMSPKPLAVQWWRGILQLVQRRFHI